jgi:putative Mn2+ efflux pump MntP
MGMVRILLLAISVSLDGLFAGMFIGMRKISFPWLSVLVTGASSGFMLAVAMPIGGLIRQLIPASLDHGLAAGLFIGIGLFALVKRSPEHADTDHSGNIGLREAFVFGLLLSLDSFVAGISAGMLGFTFWVTLGTIVACCILFIQMGQWLGRQVASQIPFRVLVYMPGLLFLVLGIMKLF